MVKQILPIQFIPTHVQPHAKASQSDTEERVFEFHCYTDDDVYNIPAGSMVMIKGAKPDGASFIRSATFAGNVVTVICSDSMTDVAGEIPCELVVTTTDGTIHSSNFILDVEGEPFNEGAVTPSDFSAFEDILQQVTEKAVDVTAMVKYADIKNDPTQTTPMQKVLDAVEKNPDVVGTIAHNVANLSDSVDTLTDTVQSFTAKAKLTGGLTEVNRGVDLNTMVTPGEYYIPSAEISNSLVNSPIPGLAGRLTIECGGQWKTNPVWVRQTIIANNSVYPYVRYSTNTGASWTPWNNTYGTTGSIVAVEQDLNKALSDVVDTGGINRVRFTKHTTNASNFANTGEAGFDISSLNNSATYGGQISVTDKNIWYRRFRSGVWQEWSAITSIFGVPIEIKAADGYTTMDQLTVPGFYYMGAPSSSGITDMPEGNAANLLITKGTDNGNPIQIFRPLNTAGVTDWAFYIRRRDPNSDWGSWWKYDAGGYTKLNYGLTAIPENTDLNTYITPGEYYISSSAIAATIANTPVTLAGNPVAGRLTVEYGVAITGTSYIRQTYYGYANNYMYWTRSSTNKGSSWGRWYTYGVATQTNNNTTAFAVANNAWTNIHEIPINGGQGIYLLDAHVRFANNATGIRGFAYQLATTETPSPTIAYQNHGEMAPAINGGYTNLSQFRVINIGANVTKILLTAYQNSGADLNAIVYSTIAKIS